MNVALGTRLLAHKFSQIPKRYSKNATGAITGYHSFDKAGEKYAEEILRRYDKALKQK